MTISLRPRPASEPAETRAPILAAERLSYTYPDRGHGPVHALERISLAVAPQEFVCVVHGETCAKVQLRPRGIDHITGRRRHVE